jgi:hypothetical protein
MKISATALLLTVAIAAPVAAHGRGSTMLKDAAVNHDLEKAKRQFEKLVRKDDAVVRALQER